METPSSAKPNPTAPGSAEALHAAAVAAVREARQAKSRGDRRRELAWLKFASAATDMYLAQLKARLP